MEYDHKEDHEVQDVEKGQLHYPNSPGLHKEKSGGGEVEADGMLHYNNTPEFYEREYKESEEELSDMRKRLNEPEESYDMGAGKVAVKDRDGAILVSAPYYGSDRLQQLIQFHKKELTRARIVGADLEGGHLNGSVFVGAVIKANMRQADIQYTDFDSADLEICFDRADLRGSSFQKANLRKCTFRGANITGVDFSEAELPPRSAFKGAETRGAKELEWD